MTSAPVLTVSDYTLDYRTSAGIVRALDGIDLEIAADEVLGLVGESGSGKSSLAWAIMRHLPGNAIEPGGDIRLAGESIIRLSAQALRTIRGRRIGMVFQDPSTSLNPTIPLGEQVAEALMTHGGLDRPAAWREGAAMLARVGLREPEALMRRYAHEASGGEKQRIVIATAFACRPECVLFDEPTTALDVITARQILDLFTALQRETRIASLYISHDLALVSRIADRVAVIHRGRIVEQGPVGRVFSAPADDYTRRLIAAVPRADRRLLDDRPIEAPPLLEARDINVTYSRPSLMASLLRQKRAEVAGNRAVTIDVRPGEVLGVVGESGSGKSTFGRALTGLARFEGDLRFAGRRIRGRSDMDQAYRRDVQIVFQHPDSSLNPRHRVADILARPLRLYGDPAGRPMARAVAELLESVQLPASYASRFPHQLSGGEKQRVAIARAFASRPKLVICDEVTSSLDVSVQAAVVELLVGLQARVGASTIFISHDINLVRQIAHRIAVMYRGELVELIAARDLARDGPAHAYTRALMDAVPELQHAAAIT
jgi:peptide/nickel transport system ATP-binding protein